MEFGIVIVVVAVILFVFLSNGFKTRCPQCGAFGSHPKEVTATEQRNQDTDLLRSSGLLDQLGGSSIAKSAANGFHHDKIRCEACSHLFDRSISIQWHGIARKIGDEKAIAEYKKS